MIRHVLLTTTLLLLAGCASVARVDAAGDVHALLIAIRDDDKAAFDARVDKVALKRQIEDRLVRETQASRAPEALKAVGLFATRAAANLAGEALIRPSVFRTVAQMHGYAPSTPIPDRVLIAAALRPAGDGRVCVTRKLGGPCVMTFAEQGDTWRLVSFDGPASELKVTP